MLKPCVVPTVTWPRDVFLGGGRMQHGGGGGDSEVIQFGSEICLQICSAANCICSDHATAKGSYIVLLVPCFTNLEVFESICPII